MKANPSFATGGWSSRPHPPSVWASSGNASPSLGTLDGDIDTEVAVVGAGFTGLNAAWELLQRGVACAVFEANDIGWGASGRNGGMAVLRYKKAWSVLAREFGHEATRHLYSWIQEALDTLEHNIAELGIDCDFKRCGHITAASSRRAGRTLEDDCAWLAAQMRDTTPRLLDAGEASALIGTDTYRMGYLDPRAGQVHPLNYARGFAAALGSKGLPIYCDTPASEIIVKSDRVIVHTPRGEVRAKKVVIATGGYTDLHNLGNDLGRRIVPVSTSVITTAPLTETQRRTILPHGHLVSDTKHLLNYFRVVPGDRLLFGGRGSLIREESPDIYSGLIKVLHQTFPQLADTAIDHRWSGKVAVTLDNFPHIGALGDRVFFALGYGGRGVALSSLLGKHLARYVLGDRMPFGPMSEAKFYPIPFHGMRIPVMNLVVTYYKVRGWIGA